MKRKKSTALLLALAMLLASAMPLSAAGQFHSANPLEGAYVEIQLGGIADFLLRQGANLDVGNLLGVLSAGMASFDMSQLVAAVSGAAVPPGSVAAAEYVDITANADLFALVNAQGFSSARHAAAALSSDNALQAAVSSHASITASATGAELEAQSVCCSRPVLQATLLPVVVYVPGQGHVVIGFVQVWICQNCGELWM